MIVSCQYHDLTGIIARFRLNKYAVSRDIEKAFSQIEIDENDRDVTRFFFIKRFEQPEQPTF
jgi:hypothetical protein